MNELILDILLRLNGEKHAIFVFDCGPLNFNGAIAMALMEAVVELRLL